MKILELELFTTNLEALASFYTSFLGRKPIEKTDTTASFQIGSSLLKFVQSAQASPYHFAINIPSNQEREALKWLKKRVDILKDEENEIQYFEHWNAEAIYFYDADRNIVEFIARKGLENPSNQAFSAESLLEISEIGMPTTNIEREYKILKQSVNLPIYSGSLERFCAIGDEQGLFIIINKTLKKEWYPTKDSPQSADFNIQFLEQGESYSFEYKNEILKSVNKSK